MNQQKLVRAFLRVWIALVILAALMSCFGLALKM